MKTQLKPLLILMLFVYTAGNSFAQVFNPGDYRDGVYDKQNAINKNYISQTNLREADLLWSKRVWREIDMREKINQPLYYPVDRVNGRISLIQLLQDYILTDKIIAFSDEEFMKPMTKDEIRRKLVDCDSITTTEATEDGYEREVKVLACDSTSIYRQIRKYRLKEDWFFDKQKSTMEVRTVGIGVFTYDEDKEADRELFWVYFPACRPYFANHEVFNIKNDAERRTFDDIFWKRQFNSTIVKESNVYDRGVNEYAKGIDALLESDRIKDDIFKTEHDLWNF
jgi:gliding motility associated protien GldN